MKTDVFVRKRNKRMLQTGKGYNRRPMNAVIFVLGEARAVRGLNKVVQVAC